MARPWTPYQIARYEAVRLDLRRRMACPDRAALPRVTVADVHRALRSAGYDRSYSYLASVLSGDKRSRPCLAECSAAVRAVRQRREADVPGWL